MKTVNTYRTVPASQIALLKQDIATRPPMYALAVRGNLHLLYVDSGHLFDIDDAAYWFLSSFEVYHDFDIAISAALDHVSPRDVGSMLRDLSVLLDAGFLRSEPAL